ncbi:MAG: TldD/PmbA family protein [Parvularculaceae bacterium]
MTKLSKTDILQCLLDDAKKAGAETCDGLIYDSLSHSVSVRLGEVEDIERSETQDLGLRVMIGQRQASVSTTDHSRASLRETAARCVAMAKAAPEDKYCGLAPKDRLAKGPFQDLELLDPSAPSTDDLKTMALACEDAARAVKGVTNSSGGGASFGSASVSFATSDGFIGASEGGSHSVSASVIAGEGEKMETDYDYDSAVFLSDLRDAAEIGTEAGTRTVAKLNPEKINSQTASVIFEQRLSASLIGHLSGAINGAAIARGVSFLKDKMGTQIFSDKINVIDDPHKKRGFGSRPFDGEGLANERLKVIDKGVLTTWFTNASQAKQLDITSSARARRGTGGPPGSGSTNLYLENGEHSLEELLQQAGTGLYLTSSFGPQVNSNTGDYSVGCSGFWIENGLIAKPVSEITIAGNILDMFRTLIPANDLKFKGSTNAPSILIPEMTIAGS